MLYNRGLQPAACCPHVALATFIRGPSHDLGISQCEKDNNFLLLRNTDINVYTISKRKVKQSQKKIF
jgi:hypothetical protein